MPADLAAQQMMLLLENIKNLNERFDSFKSTVINKIERIETNYIELASKITVAEEKSEEDT